LELAARNGGVDAVFSKYDNLSAMFKQAKLECISQARDADDTFNVISVETRKSDQVPAAREQTAPSDKTK
jgi:hypothetical protein